MRSLIVLGFSLAVTGLAPAATLWNWSFKNGTETGTLQTNGTFADTAGPFDFTIDVATFSVTASAFTPALVGQSFTTNQPAVGFLWNGSAPTQIYRSSGALTNGANFLTLDSSSRYTFGVSGGPIAALGDNNLTFSTGFSTLTLTPAQPSAVPEPSTLALAALAGLAGYAHRRRAR